MQVSEADQPIGKLDPALRAFRNGEISLGRIHEIIKAWRKGESYTLPEMLPSENCLKCKFWQEIDVLIDDENRRWGNCRRYPPSEKFDDDENDMEMGDWLMTWADQWCGEWKEKLDVA